MREYVLDVVLFTAFFFWGYFLGRRYERKKEPVEKDLSVCSCTHQYSMHGDKGKCNVVRVVYRNYQDNKYNCPCIRYDGVPPAHIYMKDV